MDTVERVGVHPSLMTGCLSQEEISVTLLLEK